MRSIVLLCLLALCLAADQPSPELGKHPMADSLGVTAHLQKCTEARWAWMRACYEAAKSCKDIPDVAMPKRAEGETKDQRMARYRQAALSFNIHQAKLGAVEFIKAFESHDITQSERTLGDFMNNYCRIGDGSGMSSGD